MIKAFDLATLLDGVEGYLHPDEDMFLATLASQVPAGQAIVEIGAYRGRSTIALAYGAPSGVLVFSVDPHDDVQTDTYKFGMEDNAAFMHNVSRAGLGQWVKVLNISSEQASYLMFGEVGLVFIDGDHAYKKVREDVRNWSTQLDIGGILAIHDSTGTWTDPTRVADELAAYSDWDELDGCAYTRVFKKIF